MEDSFEISEKFNVNADKLFFAWLDSNVHAEMTNSQAKIDPSTGGKFDIFDGYISGKTIEKIPNKKITQKWRTTEFEKSDNDSILEIIFEEIKEGTKLILRHTNIPAGQGKNYKSGWKEFYFEPMKEYFNTKRD